MTRRKLIGGVVAALVTMVAGLREYRAMRQEEFEQWRYMQALHRQADAATTRPITDPVFVEQFLPNDWQGGK